MHISTFKSILKKLFKSINPFQNAANFFSVQKMGKKSAGFISACGYTITHNQSNKAFIFSFFGERAFSPVVKGRIRSGHSLNFLPTLQNKSETEEESVAFKAENQ